MEQKYLYIAAPRGWCAGVERAIEILDVALERLEPPVYVRKEIVHNKTVVENYKKRGIRFVDEIEEVPEGGAVIFSAHGIAPQVRERAAERRLSVIDATCPLVTKVHIEVARYLKNGFTILYIGHKNHDEAIGVLGEAPGRIHIIETEAEAQAFSAPSERLAVLTQTTLSVDDTQRIVNVLRRRFPNMVMPAKEDICYATTNRQTAVKQLIDQYKIELLYVIGSQNSSNSNRLCEVAQTMGVPAQLIESVADIKTADRPSKIKIGLTAGASAPESLVREVARYFEQQSYTVKEAVFAMEDVYFALPLELKT